MSDAFLDVYGASMSRWPSGEEPLFVVGESVEEEEPLLLLVDLNAKALILCLLACACAPTSTLRLTHRRAPRGKQLDQRT